MNPTTESDVSIRIALAVGVVVAALLTIALWGPVARGLHEESVSRWCTWSATSSGTMGAADVDATVEACVQQALDDPSYMAALRASL